MEPACPLCRRAERAALKDPAGLFAAVPDRYPVSRGHTLVVPVRHVSDFFALTASEVATAMDLASRVAARLRAEHAPAGFNVGINAGAAAGQTLEHVHIHVIPRYDGDVEDPRGGIRWVVPAKARYWDD